MINLNFLKKTIVFSFITAVIAVGITFATFDHQEFSSSTGAKEHLIQVETGELDENLYNCLMEHWEKSAHDDDPGDTDDYLDEDDLALLTKIDCSNRKIKSLIHTNEGNADEKKYIFSFLTAATEINLSGNEITSVELPGELSQLTSINLEDNNLTTFSITGKVNKLTSINLFENDLEKITGISNAPNLTTLKISDNKITGTLDLSKNTKLENIHVSNMENLTGVNIGNNTVLERFRATNSGIKTLDLSSSENLQEVWVWGSKSLTGITFNKTLNGLEELRANDCSLTELAVSGADNIKLLEAHNNKISKITLPGSTEQLEVMDLYKNQISTISIDAHNLKTLDLSSNKFAKIPTQFNVPNLTKLDLSNNLFSGELDLNDLDTLTDLAVSNQENLHTIKIDKLSNLKRLSVDNNHLYNLNLNADLTSLVYLNINNNDITHQELSQILNKNVNLEILEAEYNGLTTIDLSKNTKLKELYISDNYITSIDLSKNTELTDLNIKDNKLTKLNLSKNTKLIEKNTFIGNNPYGTQVIFTTYGGSKTKLESPVTLPSSFKHELSWKSENENVGVISISNNVSYVVTTAPGITDVVGTLNAENYSYETTSKLYYIKLYTDVYNIDETKRIITVPAGTSVDDIINNISFENMSAAEVNALGLKKTMASSGPTLLIGTSTTPIVSYTISYGNVDDSGEIDVTDVKLNLSEISLIVGEKETLTPTVSPSNATNKAVTWKSSDTSVATVSSSGRVTAVGAGTATITVTTKDGNYKAECSVVVEEKAEEPNIEFSLSESSITLEIEDERTLSLNVSGIDPSVISSSSISTTWKSSNTNVATVNNGTVTAKTAGSAVITAIVVFEGEEYNLTCRVTVLEPDTIAVKSVSLSKTELDLKVGNSTVLTATVNPEDADNTAVEWSSSNSKVVTVTSSGRVTAVGAGTATITVTTKDGGYTAKCSVTVTAGNYTLTAKNEINVKSFYFTSEAIASDSMTQIKTANANQKVYVIWVDGSINIKPVLTGKDASGIEVKLTLEQDFAGKGGIYSFTMPASNVTITISKSVEAWSNYRIEKGYLVISDHVKEQNVSVYKQLKLNTGYTYKLLDKNNIEKTNGYIATGDKTPIYYGGEKQHEYVVVALGDVTGDGMIDTNDVGKLYRYVRGKVTTMEEYYKLAGDVVNDSAMDTNDVGKLYRFIRGKSTSLEG